MKNFVSLTFIIFTIPCVYSYPYNYFVDHCSESCNGCTAKLNFNIMGKPIQYEGSEILDDTRAGQPLILPKPAEFKNGIVMAIGDSTEQSVDNINLYGTGWQDGSLGSCSNLKETSSNWKDDLYFVAKIPGIYYFRIMWASNFGQVYWKLYSVYAANFVGDVNSDNTVNILDIVVIVNAILSNDIFNSITDVNEDGITNILDVVTVVNIVLS